MSASPNPLLQATPVSCMLMPVMYGGVWIPDRLLAASGLNILDKLLLAIIATINQTITDDGSERLRSCTATNAELAEFCGVSESTISRAVGRLESRNLLAAPRAAGSQRALHITSTGADLWVPLRENEYDV